MTWPKSLKGAFILRSQLRRPITKKTRSQNSVASLSEIIRDKDRVVSEREKIPEVHFKTIYYERRCEMGFQKINAREFIIEKYNGEILAISYSFEGTETRITLGEEVVSKGNMKGLDFVPRGTKGTVVHIDDPRDLSTQKGAVLIVQFEGHDQVHRVQFKNLLY